MSSKQKPRKGTAQRRPRRDAGETRGPGTAASAAAQRSEGPEGPRPARLTAAAALVAVEGTALAAAGLTMLIETMVGDPDSPRQALTGGLTMLVLAALPLIAARGLYFRRSWSRGPALITQLLAFPVAWTLTGGDGLLVPSGYALAVVALITLVLLVNPTATRALGIRPPGDA
ncbi:hypothetical protein [Streptomyces sp. GC420]|uniref:hypothetical protein n=1 Tax=Streptomyces sp. GC420 TaxID=2697568 RepID=UPI0028BE669D|nr:hypothetical protein [Streptomyces sp. GC420]